MSNLAYDNSLDTVVSPVLEYAGRNSQYKYWYSAEIVTFRATRNGLLKIAQKRKITLKLTIFGDFC